MHFAYQCTLPTNASFVQISKLQTYMQLSVCDKPQLSLWKLAVVCLATANRPHYNDKQGMPGYSIHCCNVCRTKGCQSASKAVPTA